LAVLRFLIDNKSHPTAREIYGRLREDYPTISMATVYSTLELLKKVGHVQELSIRGDKACFDSADEPHYHLFCRRCRRVIDVQTSCTPMAGELPGGHRVDEVQLYLYGVCCDCLKHPQQ
jgi:Fur family peroxide stress response transcriptional regulator